MLRALLEERFLLDTHAEIRELPVYDLVVDPKGPKVPAAKYGKPTIRVANGSIQLSNAMPGTFASQLSYALGRPVIDKTGLSGNFDFSIQWTPDSDRRDGPTTVGSPPATPEEQSSDSDGPSISTAIREQLGLLLKSARGPVEVVVLDRIQFPTGN